MCCVVCWMVFCVVFVAVGTRSGTITSWDAVIRCCVFGCFRLLFVFAYSSMLSCLSATSTYKCYIYQVAKYEVYLKRDDLISHHLDLLYDKMLEANLLKIIFPYR